MMKRFNERQWRDCDGDWFSTGMKEDKYGRYTLSSDYDKLSSRVKALEEALKKLVTMHVKHFGLDGAWDDELNKAQRLLKEELL